MAKSSTNLIKNSILTKPNLITVDELNSIGQNLNLVGYDNQLNLGSDDSNITLLYNNPSSPKLLNWVEPFEIDGVKKTLFYTEVNSGFNVGDRVFIVNGTYDSNELIKKYKYTRGNDGYRVLYVDKCIVVLDIDYTGYLPSDEQSIEVDRYDEFIKVYYVKDEKDFLLVNRQLTGLTSSTPSTPIETNLKFNKNQNNFIYVDRAYSSTVGWGGCSASTTQKGFYYRDGLDWVDVTNDFLSSSYTNLLSSEIDTNYKFIVINGTFQFGNKEFRENQVYEFNGDEWVITIKHENNNTPIITKSNFRDGYFNGKWNSGCYGSNVKRIKWYKNDAIWNSGTLLNTQWKWGFLNSLYSQKESYISEFDENGKPYQRSTNPDNDGYGYNFIINSELENYVINNGNLSNSILGSSFSNNIVYDHVTGIIDQDYINSNFTQSLVNKSVFENCFIINSNIENSIVKDSRATNSRFLNVKSINSHYNKSIFKNSNFISDNVIKILDVFKGTIVLNGRNFTYYKLYINKRSSEKFRFKDVFYIKGIKIKDSNKIIDFFDKKFKIGVWDEYIERVDSNGFGKDRIESSAFLSTPVDNKYWGNRNNDYSLDIFMDLQSYSNPDIIDIDFSNAWILNSDFESGVFENSNWNSGYHINYNSDNDITLYDNFIYNNAPIYDIELNDIVDNKLLLTVNTKTRFKETELDYFNVGDIMFLNSVEYDLSGAIDSITFSGGEGYSASNVSINSNNGRGFEISYTCDVIGSVIAIAATSANGGFIVDDIYSASNVSGNGSDLTIKVITDTTGLFVEVVNPGFGYLIGDQVSIIGSGGPSVYIINDITKGEIENINIITPGVGYSIGDELVVPGGTATIIVTNISGVKTKIPDTYTITSWNDDVLKLSSIETTSISATYGLFITSDTTNRYNYLNKVKFFKSKIVSGIFRRAYFNNCLIKNNNYDVSDRDFFNLNRIKELVITDTIFKGNKNILSDALYYNSFFIKDKTTTNDTWQNGIAFNSVWNGLSFNNGLFKESSWIDGVFENGLFYSSRSFDNNPTTQFPFYYNNRISSSYISGTISNNRYSWQKGNFKNGEFYKSDWEDGTFDDGKFYYSKFYSGNINGGIIGDSSISDTFVYNANVTYTTVENAVFEANSIIMDSQNQSSINWINGVFNNGIFSSIDNNNITSSAIWKNGIFNGGQFIKNAKWENGVFNDGRFLSTYGYGNYVSNNNDVNNYSWIDGIFNGGEFGNGSILDNSTWFNGEFNGGIFKGKEWHNGIFLYGEFNGSATVSSVGGLSSSNSNDFVAPFNTDNYYGLWRNGYFTDIKDKFINKEQFTDIKRANESNITKRAIMKNTLWLNGIFSHPGGEVNNIVWLDGVFENGTFVKSSFNPFVNFKRLDRTFNLLDTCLWKNGRLVDSEFYISKWKNGNFISGTATGMIWENGISNYMNAYNVQWDDGIWKNGNWNGSYFSIPEDGIITDEYTREILLRGMSHSATSSCHIWNLFYQDDLSNVNNSSTSDGSELSYNASGTNLPPTAPTILNG